MSKSISKTSTVVAARDQVSCDLAGEAIILGLKSGTYYGLNAVGTRIWTLVQSPIAVSAIESTVLSEYDVEPGRCERDLIGLIQQMEQVGLVEVRDETSCPFPAALGSA